MKNIYLILLVLTLSACATTKQSDTSIEVLKLDVRVEQLESEVNGLKQHLITALEALKEHLINAEAGGIK